MGKFQDLTGSKFNLLTVIEKTENKNNNGSIVWLCKCDCGNLIKLSTSELKRPERKSCGCLQSKLDDLTGKSFGRLIVIKKVEYDAKNHTTKWECLCNCGKSTIVSSANLKKGLTKSCGCLSSELKSERSFIHGDGNKDRLYRIWSGIKSRCFYKRNKLYKNYGGRGIVLCEAWKCSYMNFKNWALNNGYADDLTIDRINVNGNYEPSNCRWITISEQQYNKQNTIYLTFEGKTLPISKWADLYNVKRSTLYARKLRGWSDEEIITTPT